jgi:hypothetical protein
MLTVLLLVLLDTAQIFDPFGWSKGDLKTLKLKEIKNGRLAMLAFAGFIAQVLALNGGSDVPMRKVCRSRARCFNDFQWRKPARVCSVSRAAARLKFTVRCMDLMPESPTDNDYRACRCVVRRPTPPAPPP